jgi:hypothetical protein
MDAGIARRWRTDELIQGHLMSSGQRQQELQVGSPPPRFQS